MENTDTSHNIRENRQLLLSMRRIIKGIHIQGKLTGSFVKGSDKLVNEKVLKLKKRSHTNGVFETRKRWLTCQIGIVNRTITYQFEDGVGV